MKVAHFVRRFSRTSETFIYNFITELDKRVDQSFVITQLRENSRDRPFEPVHVIPSDVTARKLDMLSAAFGAAYRNASLSITDNVLRRTLDTLKPDIVHAQFATDACIVAPSCQRLGVPLVVSLRGYDASRAIRSSIWRSMYKRLFAATRAIVIVSEDMRERIAPLAPPSARIECIHAGKRLSDYVYLPRKPPIHRFLMIGRLVEKKAPFDAITAIVAARRAGLSVRLEIVGDGPLRDAVLDHIRAEDAGDYIRVLGELRHDLVIAKIQACDALLAPSRTSKDGDKEGIPNVVKEAILSGMPVISTRHGGIPEAFPVELHPFLADEDDPAQIFDRILQLSRMDAGSLFGMIEKANNHARVVFCSDNEVNRHVVLYRSVLS